MSVKEEAKAKLTKRYSRLAVISTFLLAFFWPLGSFFFWIFFGAIAYFVFLAYYYRPGIRTQKPKENFEFRRTRGQQESQSAPSKPFHITPKNLKLIIALIIGSVFSFMLILMVIGFVTDDGPPQSIEDYYLNENQELLSTDPNNLEVLTNVGNSFYAYGQYDSAIVYYDRVLKLDPKNSSGLYNKGLALYSKSDYNSSIEYLRQCISLYPENTDALMVLGDNYYSQNQLSQAMTWYKQAYDKGARNSGLLTMMGYVYDKQNQRSEAVRLYKQSLQQDSSQIDIYERLAELEPNAADWYKKKAEAWK